MEFLRTSIINSYLTCPARALFQIEGIETPPSVALAFGSSVHSALELNFKQKIKTKWDLPVEEIVEHFHSDFNKRLDEAVLIDEDLQQLHRSGETMLKRYMIEFAPGTVPKYVEEKITVTFKNYDFGVSGIVDLFDIYGTIIDYKTTKTKYKEFPESIIIQQSLYRIMLEAIGEKVNGNRIDEFAKDTNSIRAISLNPNRELALRKFSEVATNIQRGNFPTSRGSYLCKKRFCQHWAECEKRFGGTIKE